MVKGFVERASQAMGIRPSAARLADQIETLRGQVATLAGEHEQAEAEAVALAADEERYADAATLAGRLRGDLAEQRARLDRLEKAHADAVTRERDEEIARAEALRSELRKRRSQVYAATKEGEETEQKRFGVAMEAFRRQRHEADHGVTYAERMIEALNNERRIEANKRALLKRATEMQPGTYRPEELVEVQARLTQCDEALSELAERIPNLRDKLPRLPA